MGRHVAKHTIGELILTELLYNDQLEFAQIVEAISTHLQQHFWMFMRNAHQGLRRT